ncbi:hypothetical protein BDW59DRAFT_167857 [Aspergillus cavernicola]|uniref:Uncharacterized protein n=1 Tax=Aspergillus cavernicola TaxID=176166 RepID=A0ABR4H9V1_9EURO
MTRLQAATPQAGLPFLIIHVVPSVITQSVLGYNPQYQYLARHLWPRADRRHDDQRWLIHRLLVFSKKISFKFQHQARQVHQLAGSEEEVLTLRVNIPVTVKDLEEDSNTKNLSIQQQRAHMEKYQQYQYLFNKAMQQKNQPYAEVSADEFARQKAHDIATGQKGQAKVLSALGQVSQAMSQIYQESLL